MYFIFIYMKKHYIDSKFLYCLVGWGKTNMKCTATELEIETIISRIKSGDVNLQPDFQRGEVWSSQKKRKLIDSILRGWRIPPIHVIENANYIDEVLDGQQRLATIRDFFYDDIKIDGKLPPVDSNINVFDGYVFSELNQEVQRRFKKYSITIIRLTEYTPQEPAELFYRLNQPATLTSAEQRNAFIGVTREQIREIVDKFENSGAKKETIGFSNSRMAYDDIISKFCYTLELGTLKKKITSTDISEKYRMNNPFPKHVVEEANNILQFFIHSICEFKYEYNEKLSLNKATLFSWLIFVKRHINRITEQKLAQLIYEFEYARQLAKGKQQETLFTLIEQDKNKIYYEYPFYQSMFLMFNQKASMGSTDATSIIYRDIILELFAQIHYNISHLNNEMLNRLKDIYSEKQNLPLSIERISEIYNWGGELI